MGIFFAGFFPFFTQCCCRRYRRRLRAFVFIVYYRFALVVIVEAEVKKWKETWASKNTLYDGKDPHK